MTYSLLIVDDEPVIRRGLLNTINWNEAGIENVVTAFDGVDAIQKINENNGFDIMITDVRMPNKDGLQLAGYVSAHFPQTKIIMISGYDEFSYAQRAIQLGVEDYLLKPVDVDQLMELTEKMIGKLAKEQKESQKRQQENLLNLIVEEVFGQTLNNETDRSGWETKNLKIFFSMKKNYWELSKHLSEGELQGYKKDWKQKISKNVSRKNKTGVSLFISENILLSCFIDDSGNGRSPGFTKDYEKILHDDELLFYYYPFPVRINELNRVVNVMTQSLAQLPIKENNHLVYEDIPDRRRWNKHPEQIEEALFTATVHNDMETIHASINKLIHYFEDHNLRLGEVIRLSEKIVTRIMHNCKNVLQKEAAESEQIWSYSPDVLLIDSYPKLYEMIDSELKKIRTAFYLDKRGNNDWLINRALEYIHQYFRSDIKAQEVADVINISPSYFSSLFKQKTGKNFNEYVNFLRIEESKKLLTETPLKIGEIAEQIGYNEYKYFVEVFKKLSSVTPTEYRKLTSNHNKILEEEKSWKS
ncbi:two component transcriptional regulator, AraC family [Gracilibacillus ureilyticus]|uniref:Two component transcriptional regulator, AraC family n=1 Tax=Gracilibacillus ureilyticus TaxID=531814 RepID=A0A1H9NFU0_9BACI|nr:response regulator [Gracilibacillus ureilyticus]SER34263.1 two component transcriptional regulator, AraC family [Gracilibacillus ureilyticus]